ncbi:hypothetical protein AVEN_179524-1 [Araneus ventricosus]|uniref:Uncharacterized protein n=1 Tax=Araneus ventricosus TaxID=182803 RepID=A0A4Y2P1Z1_ARAVE|nr:hypothetical protein AVEN_179524-1 [Araneus ventricosus]
MEILVAKLGGCLNDDGISCQETEEENERSKVTYARYDSSPPRSSILINPVGRSWSYLVMLLAVSTLRISIATLSHRLTDEEETSSMRIGQSSVTDLVPIANIEGHEISDWTRPFSVHVQLIMWKKDLDCHPCQ